MIPTEMISRYKLKFSNRCCKVIDGTGGENLFLSHIHGMFNLFMWTVCLIWLRRVVKLYQSSNLIKIGMNLHVRECQNENQNDTGLQYVFKAF